MALDKGNIPIILGKGIDTKTDPKQVVAGSFLTLENATFQKTNEYTKRNGTELIGTNTTILSGNFSNTFKTELVIGSNDSVYSYDVSQDAFDLKGSRTAIDITTKTVVRNAREQSNSDSAIHSSGITAYTWVQTSSPGSVVQYCITDTVTNEYIVTPTTLLTGTARYPKVVTFGNLFVFFAFNPLNNTAFVYTLNTSTPHATPTQVALPFTSLIQNNSYDVKVVGSRLFVAHGDTTNSTSIYYYDSSMVIHGLRSVGTADGQVVGLLSDASNNVWLGVIDVNGDFNYYVFDFNLTSQITTGTLTTGVLLPGSITGFVNGVVGTFCYDEEVGGSLPSTPANIKAISANISGSVTSTATIAHNLSIASRLFQHGGNQYVLGFFMSPQIQKTYFLIDQSGNVVSKLAPGTSGDAEGFMPSVNQISTDVFQVTYMLTDLVSVVNGTIYTQSGISAVNFTFGAPEITLVGGQNLLMSGGIVFDYDGLTVSELGFNYIPDLVSTSVDPAGGSISAGTYQYLITYEWVDNQGQTHKSAPSALNGGAISVTVTGTTNAITLTIPTLRLTAKRNVSIVVYRTEANQDIFFRVSAYSAPTINNQAVATQNIIDSANDTSINGNEQLYTTGGTLDNISPPALSNLVAYNSRVFGITEEDPLTFWYSQQVLAQEPVEFTDLFSVRIEEKNGPVTSMGVMDTSLIIFKANSVYVMSGVGPAPNGSNNDFSTPQLVTTDTGCSNQRSIVPMPLGLMFQSPKGIYLLDRSLQASYIGASVEAYNSSRVTSALLMPEGNQVRFTLDSGIILAYNYFFGQWSVFTNQLAADSCVFEQVQVYVKPTGAVIQETPSAFLDWDNTPVLMNFVTSWLSFAQIQGFQRVYQLMILGDYISAHNLQVKINYDFVADSGQTTLIPVQSPPVTGVEQFRVFLQKQKCEAVQIQIQELQPTYTGQGLNLSNLSFIAGMKRGQQKVSAAVSYG